MVDFDLIVIGGNPAGLSLAAEAQEAGLAKVLVLERGDSVTPTEAVGRYRLAVRYLVEITAVTSQGDTVRVVTTDGPLTTHAVAYSEVPPGEPVTPDYDIPGPIAGRVHVGSPSLPAGPLDVLVVGGGEQAIEIAELAVERGDQVVLSMTGPASRLSRLAQETMTFLEAGRHATIFWHTQPDAIDDVGGYPMAIFRDRRTPDLQFDQVVYALGYEVADDAFEQLGMSVDVSNNRLFILQDTDEHIHHPAGLLVPAGTAWPAIRDRLFPGVAIPIPPPPTAKVDEFRDRHYNATITHFEKAHSDLWLIRVRPDVGDAAHRAGQYATLGLGYWEQRIDAAADPIDVSQLEKLVRRSYSISSPILDSRGYLVDPHESEELEFYIVLVPPSDDRIPAFTPRLARKNVGDRIYLGPRITGRYTLTPVTDPGSTVVFLATGTGEAPHNAMITELLRKGHYGPIVSAVTVRRLTDLAYEATHRSLEHRFENYHYLALPTREPEVPKRYIQELIDSGELATVANTTLDPSRTHVFLCGNPAMIGPPEWDDSNPIFPQPRGAVEALYELGFVPDRRGNPGNVHFEEYW